MYHTRLAALALLGLLIATMLLVSTPRAAANASAAPIAQDPTGTVTAATLRVRAGPSTAQPIVATLSRGAQVTVVGQSPAGDWLNVRLANGTTGWVSAQYVTVQPVARSTISLPAPPTGLVRATVRDIIDGDTIGVLINDRYYRLRYIGIDAPETNDPTTGRQPFGPEATAANRQLVAGQTVGLEKDVSETDRYSRLLRYVWVGDTLVNAELVRQGFSYASTYPPDVKYQDLLAALQREAQAAGRGLWANAPTPTPTRTPAGPTARSNANLRGGPGTNYPVIGSVRAGQALQITERNAAGNWFRLTSGAWISGSLVNGAPNVPVAQNIPAPPVARPQPLAQPAAPAQPAPAVSADCHPSYPDVCIPSPPPDLDCPEIPFRRFRVIGSDPHRFDGDHDGVGCER